MKKTILLLVILVALISFVACKEETVTLKCDGENCENTVEVKSVEKEKPEESWVVFCKSCSDKVLAD